MSPLVTAVLPSLLALAALAAPTPAPPPLARAYAVGPLALEPRATLHFSINRTAGTAHLALTIADPAYLSPNGTSALARPAWLGLGIGEPTSGHMPGADIVTAAFAPGAAAECALVDRHVPFAAHPLWLARPGAPAVFPRPDDCQGDGSWALVACARTPDGALQLEVERPLRATDAQDRPIGPGFQNLLYAYGADFGFHGSRRLSSRLAFYNDNTTADPVGMSDVPLPDDADGEIVLAATNYSLPSDKRTVYACTTRKVDLKKGQRLMVVATDPLYKADSPVHHLLVYVCSNAAYAQQFLQTKECTTSDDPNVSGPVGNSDSGCSTLIAAYAKGVKRIVMPREAGVLVTEDEPYIIMETHYENPTLSADITDSSGVKLYTASKEREHEAGTIFLGDLYIQLRGQPVVSGQQYQFTCPSTCLSRLSQPINIFSSFLHMHRTGRSIVTNRFRRDLIHIETINAVNFWNDKFQPATSFNPPKQIRPGEVLQTSCTYDTSKTGNATKFGLGLDEEMCLSTLSYWPVQRFKPANSRFNVCAFFVLRRRGGAFTECGDSARFDLETSPIWEANPAFRDLVGAPTDFGNAVETCPTEEPAPSDEPLPTLEEEPRRGDRSRSGDCMRGMVGPNDSSVEHL